jgi:hypothetical protein
MKALASDAADMDLLQKDTGDGDEHSGHRDEHTGMRTKRNEDTGDENGERNDRASRAQVNGTSRDFPFFLAMVQPYGFVQCICFCRGYKVLESMACKMASIPE